MNIFYLHPNNRTCAQYHVDKHVVKMILEYAQLMSTAHRVLDGKPVKEKTAAGRNIVRWKLGDWRESLLYKASHINHPSAVWTRASNENYYWLYHMWLELLGEYTYRYGKTHATANLAPWLADMPQNIPLKPFTEPTPAMPDQYKVSGNSVESYRNYYRGAKVSFANWKKRPVPEWFFVTNNTGEHATI